MSILIQNCEKSTVKLDLNDETVIWKASASVRNKFCKHVAPIIENTLSLADEKLIKEYKSLLYELLVLKRKEFLEDFLDIVFKIVDQTYELLEKQYNIEYPVFTEDQFEDPVTVEEFRSVFKASLALKLTIWLVHNAKDTVYNHNLIIDAIVKHYMSYGLIQKLVKFVTSAVANSKYNREAIWTYLTESIGITPEYHAQLILHAFFKTMLFLYDAAQQPNVMSYLAGFTNQALYYLFSDNYDKNIQYINISKVRYIHDYNLIKQQATFALFDMISQFINQLFLYHEEEDSSLISKVYNIKPYDISQQGIITNPVSKYVTYPFICKLYQLDYKYITEYKQLRMIEIYASLLVENVLKLPYLAKVMRSIVAGKSTKKKKMSRVKINELNKINIPFKDLFEAKKAFTNISMEMKDLLYYDPIINDLYTLNFETLIDELKDFYSTFFDDQKVETIFKPYRIWFKQPEIEQSNTMLATLL